MKETVSPLNISSEQRNKRNEGENTGTTVIIFETLVSLRNPAVVQINVKWLQETLHVIVSDTLQMEYLSLSVGNLYQLGVSCNNSGTGLLKGEMTWFICVLPN